MYGRWWSAGTRPPAGVCPRMLLDRTRCVREVSGSTGGEPTPLHCTAGPKVYFLCSSTLLLRLLALVWTKQREIKHVIAITPHH